MGQILAVRLIIAFFAAALNSAAAYAQPNNLNLGYSGTGISTDLRRVMDIERI